MIDDGNGWGRALDPDKRGRHKTFASAVAASLASLKVERNEFFDEVCANWKRLFPDQPARPGAWHDGWVVLYVNKSTTLYLMRPRLAMIRRRLAALPGAPRTVNVRLEIHSEVQAYGGVRSRL